MYSFQKITLCTQFAMSKGSKIMLYVETKDNFAYNISTDFQSTKSFGKLRHRPFQKYHLVCQRGESYLNF